MSTKSKNYVGDTNTITIITQKKSTQGQITNNRYKKEANFPKAFFVNY